MNIYCVLGIISKQNASGENQTSCPQKLMLCWGRQDRNKHVRDAECLEDKLRKSREPEAQRVAIEAPGDM